MAGLRYIGGLNLSFRATFFFLRVVNQYLNTVTPLKEDTPKHSKGISSLSDKCFIPIQTFKVI